MAATVGSSGQSGSETASVETKGHYSARLGPTNGSDAKPWTVMPVLPVFTYRGGHGPAGGSKSL